MIQLIQILFKAFYPIISRFFPGVSFSTITQKAAAIAYGEVEQALSDGSIHTLKSGKKDLGIEKIDQYVIKEPKNEFACLYSAYVMTGNKMGKAKIIPEQFDDVCVSAKAMDRNFKVLDHDRMLDLCGAKGYVSKKISIDKTNKITTADSIVASINAGCPVIVSLNGGVHYQLIVGYEKIGGELLFYINDPGKWRDTHMEASTFKVFKYKGSSRIYSTHKGVHRFASSVRIPVKKNVKP